MSMSKLKVLLTTEGTYPFHQGGVSTWCDLLVQKLHEIEFTVYSVMMDPFVSQKFNLPEQTALIKMPLWGTEEPSEHLPTPFSITYLKKKRTTPGVIKKRFILLFEEMIGEFLSKVNAKNPYRLGEILLEMHHFFAEYEYKVSFKSEETWKTFKRLILAHIKDPANHLQEPDLYGLIQSLGWVYRFLTILNTPIPRVHVTHASAAAFCGIPCVLAKLEYQTPFILTEHGVYLREQYLSLAKRKLSGYLNTFLIRFLHSITALNYAFADQVSPVCRYNTRWEQRFGVSKERIDVIYNGIDKAVFKPLEQQTKPKTPTVVTVARIDPIKDLVTLIRAAEKVKGKLPEVQFRIYGSISVPSYYEECLQLIQKLGLEQTVRFAGHTSNIMQAYHAGDVVALSSISEAFPYSVIEAMMSGKAVVTTDVGGIGEALGDTGILVDPRNSVQLAEGLLKLLENERLRNSLGEEARRRALDYFTLDQVLEHYYKSYVKLALAANMTETEDKAVKKRLPSSGQSEPRLSLISEPSINVKIRDSEGNGPSYMSQKLLFEKGLAFKSLGDWKEALSFFAKAIEQDPASPLIPILLSELATAWNELGDYEGAINEMEKMYTFLAMPHVLVQLA